MSNPFWVFENKGCPYTVNVDLAVLAYMAKIVSLELSSEARQRLKWMDAFRECGNAAQICRHFSISLRTFWRWKKRYDPWDLKSLENKSRRPKHSPKKTHILLERRVLALKREHPRWGKEKLALFLQKENTIVSASTVYRILKRHERIIRYKTKKRRAPKPRVDWAKVRSPGDLLQMDTKHLSLHGRKLYQFTLIDVVTRKRHLQVYRHADMATTVQFLQEALPTFPAVTTIQTDNGSEFGQSVTKWLREHGICHVFSHKKRPTENAYVERSHRIDEEEFYSLGNLGPTFVDLRRKLAEYLIMYNTKRPHWGLNGQTPEEAMKSYSLPSTVPHVLT